MSVISLQTAADLLCPVIFHHIKPIHSTPYCIHWKCQHVQFYSKGHASYWYIDCVQFMSSFKCCKMNQSNCIILSSSQLNIELISISFISMAQSKNKRKYSKCLFFKFSINLQVTESLSHLNETIQMNGHTTANNEFIVENIFNHSC